jgi:hypothetical protein
MNANPQTENQGMEHRWGTRIRLDAPAEVSTADGEIIPAIAINASLSGAYVRTQASAPVLSRLWLRTRQGSGDWLATCVVRHGRDGMGLEWLDPGMQAVRAMLPRGNHAGSVRIPLVARHRDRLPGTDRKLDEALEQSFPASEPPATQDFAIPANRA